MPTCSVAAALQHAQDLEQVEEEVDDVEVQADGGHDVVVGPHVVHDDRRVVEDVAREEQRAAHREDRVAEAAEDVAKEDAPVVPRGGKGRGGEGARACEQQVTGRGGAASRTDRAPKKAACMNDHMTITIRHM